MIAIETFKIYLSGKMSGLTLEEMNEWRVKIDRKLQDAFFYSDYKVQIFNPVDYYNYEEKIHQSEEEVEDFELRHVQMSDLIIVNLDGLSSSDGSKTEIFEGSYHCKIPVVAFGKKKKYDKLHPWVKRNITRVEENIDDVVSFVKRIYC